MKMKLKLINLYEEEEEEMKKKKQNKTKHRMVSSRISIYNFSKPKATEIKI